MKTLSIKIALGYIAIIALLFGAIYYINKQASTIMRSSEIEEYISSRRTACDNLISATLTAETYGQTAGLGDKTSYQIYLSSINQIDSAITSLNSFTNDSTGKKLLDSLTEVISIKSTIIKDLYTISSSNNPNTYQQQIAQLINQYSDMGTHTHIITNTIKEEKATTINAHDKNIFKRIAAIFKSGDNDSTTITSISSTSDTTSTFINHGTSLNEDFNQLNASTLKNETKRAHKLQSKINALRIANGNLSIKISSLISDIEQSEDAIRAEALNNEYKTKQHSLKITFLIAIIATIIAIIFFIIIWRDITRSNRYRKEMEAAKHRAEELLDAREKLMMTITHDIKAPTGAIIGYSELIEQSNTSLIISEYAKSINNSASHLLNLVTDLLDFHRLDAGEINLVPTNFHAASTIHEIAQNFSSLIVKKGLKLSIINSSSTNQHICCDLFRLRQILENLISNAIKFTDNGEITISSSIIDNNLNVAVTDTGKGISALDQTKIFEEFTRLKNAQGVEGSGLGLSITSKLVNLLGGTINLNSVIGKGSTFAISIPITIVKQQEQKPQTTSNNTTQSLSPIDKLNIVVIDDDPIQLKYTHTMLQNIGIDCNIHCHSIANDGIACAISSTPDIIFTDIQMPHIDGFELLAQVRKNLPDTPVIAMTANSNIKIEEYLKKGFNQVLPKPYKQQQLIDIIQQFFDTNEIDFSPITQFADNDEETINLLLTTTLDETLKNEDAITNAIKATDKESVCAIAHKMLPLITMVKIQGLDAFEYFNSQRDKKGWNNNDDIQAQSILKTISLLITHLKRSISDKKD